MQRNKPTSSNNEALQQHSFPRAPKDNIRRDLLRSTISKKSTRVNDRKPDNRDSLLSSDENSDCCSEPTNETEDICCGAESGSHYDRKSVITVDPNLHISDTCSILGNTRQSIDPDYLAQRPRNRSGSLQNNYDSPSVVT